MIPSSRKFNGIFVLDDDFDIDSIIVYDPENDGLEIVSDTINNQIEVEECEPEVEECEPEVEECEAEAEDGSLNCFAFSIFFHSSMLEFVTDGDKFRALLDTWGCSSLYDALKSNFVLLLLRITI